MKIADIDLGEKPLLLAPMEDVTDPSFRYMCKRFGADVVYTEFISSDGLIRDAAKSLKKLEIDDAERPVGIQIYGHLIDPECERKLERAREKILNLIRERRPRFVPAFELMRVQGNTISLSVPTSELREEILRSKTGMLMRIAELAGITGAIELEVVVNEEIRAARPIKLEDRVKYMTEKNPLIAELRKALDLEVE